MACSMVYRKSLLTNVYKSLENNQKRNGNVRAGAETADMFLQKGQLTGQGRSADGPFG